MAALRIVVGENIEPDLAVNFPADQHPGLFHLHLVGKVVGGARNRVLVRPLEPDRGLLFPFRRHAKAKFTRGLVRIDQRHINMPACLDTGAI